MKGMYERMREDGETIRGKSERNRFFCPGKIGKFIRETGRILVLILSPVLACLGFLYIYIVDPARPGAIFFTCPIYMATGFYCPADGNTRALHALVHLNIPEVFQNNILFPFIFLIFTWLLVGEYLKLLLRRRVLWLPKKIKLAWVWIGLSIVFIFTICRNIPIYPFTILAPGT